MRLQVDNEFQQVKLKDLNDQNNVEMFTSSVWGRKAFAAERKIRELKTRISKLNAQKLKISLTKIILSSANNMNNLKNMDFLLKKLKKIIFWWNTFNRIEKTKLLHDRVDRYDKKKYLAKRRKLRENLNIGEKV